jgi:hypothetical protein
MTSIDNALYPMRRESGALQSMRRESGALQSMRRESEERRDPREVFREFLDHLGRAARRRPEKLSKANGRRSAGK